MNEVWAATQSRLKKWQKESSTAWNLRRILSDSEYFNFIGQCAADRANNRPDHVSWQDWWAFYLERLTEKEAVTLLLEVWNKDVWAHLQLQIKKQTSDFLTQMSESSFAQHGRQQRYLSLMDNTHHASSLSLQDPHGSHQTSSTESTPPSSTALALVPSFLPPELRDPLKKGLFLKNLQSLADDLNDVEDIDLYYPVAKTATSPATSEAIIPMEKPNHLPGLIVPVPPLALLGLNMARQSNPLPSDESLKDAGSIGDVSDLAKKLTTDLTKGLAEGDSANGEEDQG